MGQDMANRSALRAVTRAVAPAVQGLRTATRPNKKHGAGTIYALIALAVGSGATAGRCLELREFTVVADRVPTAEWPRVVMRTCDAGVALRAPAARQLRSLRGRGEIPAEIVVTFDMHGIPKYVRTTLEWLVRGRCEGDVSQGTSRMERYMTAQCAANMMWVVPGTVRVMPGDSV